MSTPKGKATHLEGRLNGAHASLSAMNHAALNSTVGQIAAYKDAVQAYMGNPTQANLTTAATALANVANKGVTAQTVTNLNNVIGLSTQDQPGLSTAIADKAQAIQAGGAETATATATR
jgi:hypothetical protein